MFYFSCTCCGLPLALLSKLSVSQASSRLVVVVVVVVCFVLFVEMETL